MKYLKKQDVYRNLEKGGPGEAILFLESCKWLAFFDYPSQSSFY